MTLVLRPATDYHINDLVSVLNESYEDYPVPIHFSPAQFEFFVQAHAIDLALSVAAEIDGELAGIAQLAQHGPRGWVAGVGVRASARRRGIARAMMEVVVDNARTAGITHLQLEVLCDNVAAVVLYQGLGWQAQRDLLIWRRKPERQDRVVSSSELVEADALKVLAECYDWHEQPPCWQRQESSLRKYVDLGMKAWTVQLDNEKVAYALGARPRRNNLHLLDIAVNPRISIKDSGVVLLQALHDAFPNAVVHLFNEPSNSPLTPLLSDRGYIAEQHQWEMKLDM